MDGFVYKTLVKMVFILLLVIVSCNTETVVEPLPTCTQIDTTFTSVVQVPIGGTITNDSIISIDTTTVSFYQCL